MREKKGGHNGNVGIDFDGCLSYGDRHTWKVAKTKKILLPKDYIRYRLTGEYAAEVSDAAGSLMFDVAGRRWAGELLKELDIRPELLPECFESSDVCGKVTPEAARATGLAAGTPVVGGGADNTCGAIGTGVIREGQVTICTL